jgi:hypothetical protein
LAVTRFATMSGQNSDVVKEGLIAVLDRLVE